MGNRGRNAPDRGRKRGQGLVWPMTRTDRGGTAPTAPNPHRQTVAISRQRPTRTDRAGVGEEQGKGEERVSGEWGGGTAAPPPELRGYH